MGQGLVIEGPSGIGKTTATKKVLQKVADNSAIVWIASRDPTDTSRLKSFLDDGVARQHLVVDDFHYLEFSLKRSLANAIKVLADRNSRDAKITVVGINPVGASLVEDFPDLVGRFETVSMVRQPDSKIDELIARGEEAANLAFEYRSEFIQAAHGSFFTAQQLCFHAAIKAGFSERLERAEAKKQEIKDLDKQHTETLRSISAEDLPAREKGKQRSDENSSYERQKKALKNELDELSKPR